jgi:hypothetical protein
MTVTKVDKDKVYCGSTSFRKSDGQEIGANDHMYASPIDDTKANEGSTGAPQAPKAKKTAKAKTEDAEPKKPSALDAAAKVLAEAGQPMNCQEMIKVMAEKGHWTPPAGKTPAATLYSAIIREIKVTGAIKDLDLQTYGVIVVDSISHLWDACKNAFSGRPTKAGTIPLHAWAAIKTVCPDCSSSEHCVFPNLNSYHSLCRAA